MSKLLRETNYTPKQLENNWINSIFHSHDLFCGCNNPTLHLITILNRGGNAPKPEPEIKNILCLITGKEDKDTEEDDLPFGPGELEKLFEETDGENKEEDAITADG